MAYKKRIMLDLDGVLHKYSGWNGGVLGEPMPKARQACLMLEKQYELWVFTSRARDIEGAATVASWLAKHGFPKMHITAIKEPCHLMIDDRAIEFRGVWNDDLLTQIRSFCPHWQGADPPADESASETAALGVEG